MIVPSIDLLGGQAVQLIGGKERAIDAGDPLPIARSFSIAGEIAVIDLDAALGQGDNRELIERLVSFAPCRVGGGIRDLETARRWLDAGAERIILGTKAVPELLSALPRERLIAAVDADDGEVVVEGWRTKTGRSILEVIAELKPYVSGFLVTFVEREGRMQGTNIELVSALVEAAHPARVTIAGGVTTASEIAELDRLGADAQVGMALYSGKLGLGEAIAAPLTSDRPDGLWPTVVCNERGTALGLCWSDAESVSEAVKTRSGVYRSRTRGLWRKGETSGAIQELLRVDLDCDRDALLFTVRQAGAGFCHLGTFSCWGRPPALEDLVGTLTGRATAPPEGSYTARLLADPELLAAKLLEEAREVVDAESQADSTHEIADLFYFALVRAVQKDVRLEDIERELRRRTRKVTRRGGERKDIEGRKL